MTFAELIDKYVKEITVNKGGARSESLRLNRIAKTPLGAVALEDLSNADFERWQEKCLTGVSVLSVLRERGSLSVVVTQAIWVRSYLAGKLIGLFSRSVIRPDLIYF